jgi:CRP-like cAMP-binding protein
LYAQVLLCQTSQAALCNQHHSVEQKFCRWLLASMDRLDGDTMAITQAQISHLLGARRETVTKTARRLQKDGLIENGRGSITLLDRTEMEARVCECYETVKSESERLMPRPKASR